MEVLLSFPFFVLGIIIGSFLNVVILRYNSGRTLGGRSSCPSCGHMLTWYELIPLISFIRQKGKCARCESKISWQYPLVELITGVLFTATFVKFYNFPHVILYTCFFSVLCSLLIIIAVYDLHHKIIPNGIVYTFDMLSLAVIFIPFFYHTTNASITNFVIAGPLLALPFALLWLFSGGRWMGLGDAKLILGLGWLLGLRAGFSAIVFGIWIAAAVSIILIILQQSVWFSHSRLISRGGRFTMKSELPLAPFLIIGFLLVFFYNADLITVIQQIGV